MSKLQTFLKNPDYFLTSPASKGYLNWVPDEIYLKLLYRLKLKERCNLKAPVKYNEKLQWMKLYDRNPLYSQLVDKYEVRKYIAETVGEEYLIPCYGVYDSFDEIDFDALPSSFVLKCTHDSGSVVICRDKAAFDKAAAGSKLTKALKKDYYAAYREWPYKNVKHRIIAEKFMADDSGDDLKDYKIMCFHGRAEVVEVHENRFVKGKEHTQTFYDRDWKKLGIIQHGLNETKENIPKPALMDEMFRLSELVAKDMLHARVDWYIINNQIYFGEVTFFDGSGFEYFPNEADDIFLGSFMHLQ